MDIDCCPRAGEIRIDSTVRVPASAQQLYAFLADIQDAEPQPRRAKVRMVKEPSGPTGVGTTWHEAVQLMPGWWLHIDSVVTEARRPSVLSMRFHSWWWSGLLRYDVSGDDGGSVLRHREILRPRRGLRPFAPWIARRLRPTIDERLHDIATAVGERARQERRHSIGTTSSAEP